MRYLIYCLVPTVLFSVPDNWKFAKSADGVTAYTRAVSDSGFKEYKVETEVDATLMQVVAVLMDVKSLTEWVDRCSEANIVKDISATESITRTVTSSPFPLKNREALSQGRLVQDPASKIVRLISVGKPDYLPENSKYQRVVKVRGLWIITPKPTGKILIQMIGHTDPGGIIPAPIANQFVVMIPFNTIKNLRNQIKKEKYSKVKLSYIKE